MKSNGKTARRERARVWSDSETPASADTQLLYGEGHAQAGGTCVMRCENGRKMAFYRPVFPSLSDSWRSRGFGLPRPSANRAVRLCGLQGADHVGEQFPPEDGAFVPRDEFAVASGVYLLAMDAPGYHRGVRVTIARQAVTSPAAGDAPHLNCEAGNLPGRACGEASTTRRLWSGDA